MNFIPRRKPFSSLLLNQVRASFCSIRTPPPCILIHQDKETQSLQFDLPARTTEAESESKFDAKMSLMISNVSKSMTVRDLVHHFQDFDPTLETVQMIHSSNESAKNSAAVLAQSTKINTMYPGSFKIQLNDQIYPTTCRSGETIFSLATEDNEFVSSYQHLKHHLMSRSNRQISMEDYFKLCQTLFGTQHQYASAWLEQLEQDQLILRCRTQDQVTILLPDSEMMEKGNDSNTDYHAMIQDLEQELLGQLQVLKNRIQNLESEERVVTQSINTQLQRYAWLGFAGLNAQFGGLAYLVWDVHSWDVMEPITFFIGLAYAIGASCYFSMTKKDANYSNLYRRSFARRFHQAMKPKILSDSNQFETSDDARKHLKEQVQSLGRQLEWIQYVGSSPSNQCTGLDLAS